MNTSDPLSQINAAITEALTPLIEENTRLQESVEDVRRMFDYEDLGWQVIFGVATAEVLEGLSLKEVQAVSEKARTRVSAGSLPKRAVNLHTGYVFGNNLEIEGTERNQSEDSKAKRGGKTGRPRGEVTFFENPINQENIFSGAAKAELQSARFTDGNVIVFCDKTTKEVRRVPIYEIEDVLVNPDYPEEIWAWLRTWTRINMVGDSVQEKAWVYSNRFKGDRKESIKTGDESVAVLENVTAVDLRANRQVGWTLGIPDATAGLHWTEAYGQVLRYGQIVNEGLASIIYKVTGKKSQAGAQNVGVKLATGGTAKAAVMGEGQDIQLMNATQRTFDFSAARPLAAMAASAWNVSNIDLLADSSAAGSSYGAAQSLSEGVRNAMNLMRDEWTQFYQDIFAVFGFNRPVINWPPMEKPDAYREAQSLVLYSRWLKESESRAVALDRLNIVADPDDLKGILAVDAAKQAASPDQGRSNQTGGQDSGGKNDQRTDTIESYIQRFANEEFLEKLEHLVLRMESVNSQ